MIRKLPECYVKNKEPHADSTQLTLCPYSYRVNKRNQASSSPSPFLSLTKTGLNQLRLVTAMQLPDWLAADLERWNVFIGQKYSFD